MKRTFAPGLALVLSSLVGSGAVAQDGNPDTTFSSDGLLLVGWSGDAAQAQDVRPGPGGSLFVGGSIDESGNWNLGVAKVDAGGAVDLSWGSLGRRTIAVDAEPGQSDDLLALSPFADGSLLVAGLTTVETNVGSMRLSATARLTPDGDLDPVFGVDGIRVVDLPWTTDHWWWEGAVVQSDGKILFYGNCEDCPDAGAAVRPMLLRIGLDGLPDPTFSGDGWAVPVVDPADGFYPQVSTFDGQGRLLVLGSSGSQKLLVRFTVAGALDGAFGGGDGIVSVALPLGHNGPWGFVVDPDTGAMYVAMAFVSGPYEDFAGVVRLSSAGAIDPTFAGDGLAEIVFDDRLWVTAMKVQSDGKLVGVGMIEPDSTSPSDFLLFRLLADGAFDSTFHGNGVRRVTFGQSPDGSDSANAMALAGGRLVAFGSVTTPTGQRFGVTRVTSTLIFTDGFERGSTATWPEI
jgi:uncharacterized delta-60 repeat protein